MEFRSHMDVALAQAQAAAARGEVPVGAVIADPKTNQILAATGNRTRELHDPTAHAEILALRTVCATKATDRLPGLDLYVTLEPCPMCAAALSAARVARIYYAAPDPKSGGIEQGPCVFSHPQAHHTPEVYGGLREAQAAALLQDFFENLRRLPASSL